MMSSPNSEAQSIKIHSEQSDQYKWRTPYIPDLLDSLCRELFIGKRNLVLDLGCGTGELAKHISRYAGKVIAIDGSRSMIGEARDTDNIEFQVVDLNASDPNLNGRADHFFFGRSIHWFSPETLQRLSERYLNENGKIVVCSTQWSPIGPWGKIYLDTKREYVPSSRKPSGLDFKGEGNLGAANFISTKKMIARANVRIDSEYLANHTLSITYREELEQLRKTFDKFKLDLKNALAPYEERREIVINIVSWALIYERKKQECPSIEELQ